MFDLQAPKVLGELINKVPNSDGFDHNFCVMKESGQEKTFVARYSVFSLWLLLTLFFYAVGSNSITSNSVTIEITENCNI